MKTKIHNIRTRINLYKDLFFWIIKGRPSPPPHFYKQKVIFSYAKKFNCKVLVETGTYLGETVEAGLDIFEEIYSIELSEELYKQALVKFNNNHNVTLFQGDSSLILPSLIHKLNKPTIFWLDGHYSGGFTAMGEKETPIIEELLSIFSSNYIKNYIILIDDARCFGSGDYPSIKELIKFSSKEGLINVTIKDDIIRIVP